MSSSRDWDWNITLCTVCKLPLKEHWRGRECMPYEQLLASLDSLDVTSEALYRIREQNLKGQQ
jgi:hypothetical protein